MIGASVGYAGVNAANDVKIVQCGLNVARSKSGIPLIAIDGLVGPETIGAIRLFQRFNFLVVDGRIDVNGPSLARLRSALGSEAAIFGPLIAELLSIQEQLFALSHTLSGDLRTVSDGLFFELNRLRKFGDLAVGVGGQSTIRFAAFHRGGNVIGFTGVEETVVAVAVIGFFWAILLIIMVRSPSFQRAVEARAKELDRIFQQFHITMSLKFQEAIDLIVSILDEAQDTANKCKNSPTFTPSPECNEALALVKNIAQRMRNALSGDVITSLIQLFKFGSRGGRVDVTEIKRQIEVFLRKQQQQAVDLQVELQNMRDKCNCPDV